MKSGSAAAFEGEQVQVVPHATGPDAVADASVEEDHAAVHGQGEVGAAGVDQGRQRGKQYRCNRLSILQLRELSPDLPSCVNCPRTSRTSDLPLREPLPGLEENG